MVLSSTKPSRRIECFCAPYPSPPSAPHHLNFSVSQSLALCGISAENQSVLLSRGMEINDAEIVAWLKV